MGRFAAGTWDFGQAEQTNTVLKTFHISKQIKFFTFCRLINIQKTVMPMPCWYYRPCSMAILTLCHGHSREMERIGPSLFCITCQWRRMTRWPRKIIHPCCLQVFTHTILGWFLLCMLVRDNPWREFGVFLRSHEVRSVLLICHQFICLSSVSSVPHPCKRFSFILWVKL